MKLKNIFLLGSLITTSAVIANNKDADELVWNDKNSAWEDMNSAEMSSGVVFETVTFTTTWVPPDIVKWAYPEEYFAATQTVYDTEEEAKIALERSRGRKKKFRRKKKHFKKKSSHHGSHSIKPQVYLDEEQASKNANDEFSMQEGDVIIEEWEDQYGNVIAASDYSYNSASNIKKQDEIATAMVSFESKPSASMSLETAETLFPKVLLKEIENGDVEAASSSGNLVKSAVAWTSVSVAIACFIVFI